MAPSRIAHQLADEEHVSLLVGRRWVHGWTQQQTAEVNRPGVVVHKTRGDSVRAGGDTKTKKSRRTLALPARCVEVLKELRSEQEDRRKEAGRPWDESALVFASTAGTELDAANVRRAFRDAIRDADGVNAAEWTPRELRHSFVSLLSDNGVPLEEVSRLVGHSNTTVTEEIYRKQIRPVIQTGAVAMDRIFRDATES